MKKLFSTVSPPTFHLAPRSLETSYQMLEVLFILRSRVGSTSFDKNNLVNFPGEKIKRSFPLCFFLENAKITSNQVKSRPPCRAHPQT